MHPRREVIPFEEFIEILDTATSHTVDRYYPGAWFHYVTHEDGISKTFIQIAANADAIVLQ